MKEMLKNGNEEMWTIEGRGLRRKAKSSNVLYFDVYDGCLCACINNGDSSDTVVESGNDVKLNSNSLSLCMYATVK